jgi:hypothetical protein
VEEVTYSAAVVPAAAKEGLVHEIGEAGRGSIESGAGEMEGDVRNLVSFLEVVGVGHFM